MPQLGLTVTLREYDVHALTIPWGIGKRLGTVVSPDQRTADLVAGHLFEGSLFVSPKGGRRRGTARDFRGQARKK